MIVLEQYVDLTGRNTFERWLSALDSITNARIVTALKRLEVGNLAAKGVGAGVMELRLDFGPGYRIYFGRDGKTLIILLAGGTKQKQPTDIALAQRLWREYKRNKQER